MKIIGSLTSPFTRIVRTVCEELSLEYEHDVTLPFVKMDARQQAHVNAHNPLMKVPVLIDGDVTLLDSRIIVQHLVRHYGESSGLAASLTGSPGEENLMTVLHGMMDAGVLWFMLRATHPGIEGGFIARSQERLSRGFDWLKDRKELADGFGVNQIALVCALEWFAKRSVYPWQGIESIAGIHAAYANKPCLVKTRIPEKL